MNIYSVSAGGGGGGGGMMTSCLSLCVVCLCLSLACVGLWMSGTLCTWFSLGCGAEDDGSGDVPGSGDAPVDTTAVPGVTTVPGGSTPVSGGTITAAPDLCASINDMRITARDLTQKQVSTPADCCTLCSTATGCQAWTYDTATQTCSLKKGVTPFAAAAGFVSGVRPVPNKKTPRPPGRLTTPPPTTSPSSPSSRFSKSTWYSKTRTTAATTTAPQYTYPYTYPYIAPTTPAPTACPLTNVVTGRAFGYGNTLSTSALSRWTDCCSACAKTTGCAGWMWTTNRCELKKYPMSYITRTGAVAGLKTVSTRTTR